MGGIIILFSDARLSLLLLLLLLYVVGLSYCYCFIFKPCLLPRIGRGLAKQDKINKQKTRANTIFVLGQGTLPSVNCDLE